METPCRGDADIVNVPDRYQKVELGSTLPTVADVPVPDKNEVNFDMKTYSFNSRRCLGQYPLCLRPVGDHFNILVWDRSAISRRPFFDMETRLKKSLPRFQSMNLSSFEM